MFNKKMVIEMLNEDTEAYQHFFELWEKSESSSDRIVYWNEINRYSSSLNARKQMCIAFGYRIVYDENEKIVDVVAEVMK